MSASKSNSSNEPASKQMSASKSNSSDEPASKQRKISEISKREISKREILRLIFSLDIPEKYRNELIASVHDCGIVDIDGCDWDDFIAMYLLLESGRPVIFIMSQKNIDNTIVQNTLIDFYKLFPHFWVISQETAAGFIHSLDKILEVHIMAPITSPELTIEFNGKIRSGSIDLMTVQGGPPGYNISNSDPESKQLLTELINDKLMTSLPTNLTNISTPMTEFECPPLVMLRFLLTLICLLSPTKEFAPGLFLDKLTDIYAGGSGSTAKMLARLGVPPIDIHPIVQAALDNYLHQAFETRIVVANKRDTNIKCESEDQTFKLKENMRSSLTIVGYLIMHCFPSDPVSAMITEEGELHTISSFKNTVQPEIPKGLITHSGLCYDGAAMFAILTSSGDTVSRLNEPTFRDEFTAKFIKIMESFNTHGILTFDKCAAI
jgi:hypothetical protein